MYCLCFVARNKQRKETFPDLCSFDLARRGASSPQEEVSDSFHWLLDFDTGDAEDTGDAMQNDKSGWTNRACLSILSKIVIFTRNVSKACSGV